MGGFYELTNNVGSILMTTFRAFNIRMLVFHWIATTYYIQL